MLGEVGAAGEGLGVEDLAGAAVGEIGGVEDGATGASGGVCGASVWAEGVWVDPRRGGVMGHLLV